MFRRSRPALVLYSLWLIFLILSFGGYTPVYRLLARSPDFPFRAPSRFLLVATFAAASLSAFGFQQLFSRSRWRLLAFATILGSAIWQAYHQLKNYFITKTILDPGFPTTTPLPLSAPISEGLFVVKFHQGLIISLISLVIVFYFVKNKLVYAKVHRPSRSSDPAYRR